MPPKATALKPGDSPKPGMLAKRPLGSAGRGAERLSIAEPAAKAKSPRAADNAAVAALRNGAAAAALLARKTPPKGHPVDLSLKEPKRGVPRGLVVAAADEDRADHVTRMESLARLVNNLPDAASVAEEERQQLGSRLGALGGDPLLADRSRSESVEHFLRASEQVEANLERLQEALSRASSQDDEFFSKLVGRVDSAIARNPMAPSTPRTPAAGEKHFFGGGDEDSGQSEEQKKLFEEMQAQDVAAARGEAEAQASAGDYAEANNPEASPAAGEAGGEVAQLRAANAALAAQVAELAEALARAEERTEWAVKKTDFQKKQLLEVRRSTQLFTFSYIYCFSFIIKSFTYLITTTPYIIIQSDPFTVLL